MNVVDLDKLNPQQRLAVTLQGQSLLVSAAAGSGKTFVLSRRIINRLFDESNSVDADKLLVVTFTNAAAAEMKSRIMAALTELSVLYPENENILRQQMLLEGAKICTIDSFCLDLVRRYAAELDLDEDFAIGDQNRLQLIREKVLTEILEEEYRALDPAFLQLAAGLTRAHDRPLRELVEQVDEFLQSLPFPDIWMKEKLALYSESADTSSWLSVFWQKAQAHLKQAESNLRQAYNQLPSITDKRSGKWKDGLDAYQEILTRFSQSAKEEYLAGMKETAGLYKQIKISLRALDDEERALKIFIDNTRSDIEAVAELFSLNSAQLAEEMETLRPVCEKLFDMVRRFRTRLMEEKKKARQFDFSDIEAFAASLLFTHGPEGVVPTPLAKELSDEIAEIYIDEFQDINQMQYHLFMALAKPNNLFLVGDVKQSIYRFRQASPEIFLSLKNSWPAYGSLPAAQSVLSLPVNYRSSPAVINALNFFFRQLMHTDTAEIEYTAEEELVCGEPEKHDPPGLFSLILVDIGEGQSDSRAEGRAIAAEIQKLVGIEKIPGKDGPRPIRYGDICILVRSRSQNDELMAGLKDFNIPVIGDESGDFFKLPEILSVLSVLRAVNNPTQDVPLLAAMMSPLYAFTPDEMAQIKTKGQDKKQPLYTALTIVSQEESELGEKCRNFLSHLSEFRRLSTLMGTAELIHTIADRTGFYAAASAMTGGGDRVENVRRLVVHAEAFEQSNSRSLAAFLRYADRLSASLGGSNEGPEAATDSNMVKILSIHKSKGLEFPVCFVAGGHKKFNRMDQAKMFSAHREMGFGMKMASPDGSHFYIPLIKQAIDQQAIWDSLAEEMRIWYVALSRAKSRLILTFQCARIDEKLKKWAERLDGAGLNRVMMKDARSPADWLIPAAMLHPSAELLRKRAGKAIQPLDAPDVWDVRVVVPQSPPEAQLTEETAEEIPFDEKLVEEIDRRLSWQYPYRELTALPRKFTVSELAKEKLDKVELSSPDFSAQESGASRGSATHRFMEECDFTLAAQSIENEISRLVRQGLLSEREGRLVNREKTASFFSSPLFERIQQAIRVDRERDFIYQLPAGRVSKLTGASAEEKVILQGCADCVVFEEDGLLLIDYKTDRMESPQDFIQRYALQLELYAEALTELYKIPVKEKIIFSFHLGEAIDVT